MCNGFGEKPQKPLTNRNKNKTYVYIKFPKQIENKFTIARGNLNLKNSLDSNPE